MTDEKGAVKYTYAYNPYGGLTQGSYGQVMFLFNGQYGVVSDDNGLYYMRARYYNISIKRFINQDVVTGSIAESQSLNRYAYVEGNPVSYFDSFGLEKVDTSGLNGTFMAGMQGNITAGILPVYGQVGIANDAQGNKDILVTVGANLGLGMGAGGGIFKNTTNAKTVKDLLGWGFNFGTSVGMPVAVGAGGNIVPNEEKNYYGVTESVNVGGKVEVHAGPSYTFSLLELYKKSIKITINFYKKVLGI